MELKTQEKLMLVNQYKILEALYPNDKDFYAKQRNILEKGYTLHYTDLFSEFSHEIPKDQCKEVIDILNMYRTLKFSYYKLISTGSLKEEEIDPYLIRFQGFDSNDKLESCYLSYAIFFMHGLGGFKELHNENKHYNAPSPKLDFYRELFKKFEKIYDPMLPGLLSKDEINEIFKI